MQDSQKIIKVILLLALCASVGTMGVHLYQTNLAKQNYEEVKEEVKEEPFETPPTEIIQEAEETKVPVEIPINFEKLQKLKERLNEIK